MFSGKKKERMSTKNRELLQGSLSRVTQAPPHSQYNFNSSSNALGKNAQHNCTRTQTEMLAMQSSHFLKHVL